MTDQVFSKVIVFSGSTYLNVNAITNAVETEMAEMYINPVLPIEV